MKEDQSYHGITSKDMKSIADKYNENNIICPSYTTKDILESIKAAAGVGDYNITLYFPCDHEYSAFAKDFRSAGFSIALVGIVDTNVGLWRISW